MAGADWLRGRGGTATFELPTDGRRGAGEAGVSRREEA
jgi:hypothetical protein